MRRRARGLAATLVPVLARTVTYVSAMALLTTCIAHLLARG